MLNRFSIQLFHCINFISNMTLSQPICWIDFLFSCFIVSTSYTIWLQVVVVAYFFFFPVVSRYIYIYDDLSTELLSPSSSRLYIVIYVSFAFLSRFLYYIWKWVNQIAYSSLHFHVFLFPSFNLIFYMKSSQSIYLFILSYTAISFTSLHLHIEYQVKSTYLLIHSLIVIHYVYACFSTLYYI